MQKSMPSLEYLAKLDLFLAQLRDAQTVAKSTEESEDTAH